MISKNTWNHLSVDVRKKILIAFNCIDKMYLSLHTLRTAFSAMPDGELLKTILKNCKIGPNQEILINRQFNLDDIPLFITNTQPEQVQEEVGGFVGKYIVYNNGIAVDNFKEVMYSNDWNEIYNHFISLETDDVKLVEVVKC